MRSFPVWGALASLFLVHCSLTDLDGLSDGKKASDGSNSNGSNVTPPGSSTAGSSGSTQTPPDNDAAALPAGQIYCALTSTACDVTSAQCCITLVGESSAAARSLTSRTAKCTAPDTGCNQFVGTGTGFTKQFPQRCAAAKDCGTGESCCVVASAADRFAKDISEIACRPTATCNTTGRVLCTSKSDCAATENCLPETDPILSEVYENFCR